MPRKVFPAIKTDWRSLYIYTYPEPKTKAENTEHEYQTVQTLTRTCKPPLTFNMYDFMKRFLRCLTSP